MYKLTVTTAAERDLDEIIVYLLTQFENQTAAANLLDRIAVIYDNLTQNPLMYEYCHDPQLQMLGYRRAILGKYLMFYRVDEAAKTVFIMRYVYGPSDYAGRVL